MSSNEPLSHIVLGGGCFWCLEPVFNRLKGVHKVACGYTGGEAANPTYESVCSGQTGHAEVISVTFDESEISLKSLLKAFFVFHDPTTLNRQGNDIGTQYRSVIFFTNQQQKNCAAEVIDILNASDVYEVDIVTELEPLGVFYEAEAYHQQFYEKNPNNRYCQFSIEPKLKKLSLELSDFLKTPT